MGADSGALSTFVSAPIVEGWAIKFVYIVVNVRLTRYGFVDRQICHTKQKVKNSRLDFRYVYLESLKAIGLALSQASQDNV